MSEGQLPSWFHAPTLRRSKDEPWRDVAARYAKPHGQAVVDEVLEVYDRILLELGDEYRAAWTALHDCNALEFPRRS